MILRDEYRAAGGEAEADQLHEKRDLPRQTHRRDRQVAEAADHQRVHEAERGHEQILQRNGQRQRQQHAPKRFFKQSEFFHRLLYIAPISNDVPCIGAISIVSDRRCFFKEERGKWCGGGEDGRASAQSAARFDRDFLKDQKGETQRLSFPEGVSPPGRVTLRRRSRTDFPAYRRCGNHSRA